MSQNSAVAFPHPQAASADPLTKVLRQGAKRLLAQAIEAEVETLLACYADVRDDQGRQGVVRNGYLPEREVQTVSGQNIHARVIENLVVSTQLNYIRLVAYSTAMI